jgi:uncharacterized protein (DUF885 family)
VAAPAPEQVAAPPAALPPPLDFARTRDEVMAWWLADSPARARQAGMHDFDGKVDDVSPAAFERRIARLRQFARDLARIAREAPPANPDDRLDLAILQHMIDEAAFFTDDRQEHRKHPGIYMNAFSVEPYLADELPLAERARHVVAHNKAALAQVPHAGGHLSSGPLSKAIARAEGAMLRGFAGFVRKDLPAAFAALTDPALLAEVQTSSAALADGVDHLAMLVKRWETEGDDSHILGVEKYRKLLRVQEGYTGSLADFKRLAEEDLVRNRLAYDRARKGVKVTRPAANRLLATATQMMRMARDFVRKKDIVTLPTDELPVVRESPPYMRWNGASILASGPFAKSRWAYFNITLPDPKWPRKEQLAYIPTHGSLLAASVVHEAIPGHFVQFRFRDRAPTRLQRMAWNYSFIEGWAHYAEQMMIDEGLGGRDPQYRVGVLADALRRDCRVLASIGLHTEGMTLPEAERLFRERCDQDPATARQQAERGTFDPGYFAYTFGKLQIMALREEARRELGARFSLGRFHDALLSHGAVPLPLLRERVLADLRGR